MWTVRGERARRRPALAPAVVLAFLALLILGACAGDESATGPQATLPGDAADPKALGPADAKVVVTEYADFQ